MLRVEVTARVTYTCFLDDNQSKKVFEYANKHGCELEEAVEALYDKDIDFNMYKDSVESDFMTESIDIVEED